MTFDPSAFVHTASTWLEAAVKYEGPCRAEFGDPKLAIESPGTICFGTPDGGSVEIECDPNSSGPSLDSATPPSGDYRLHGDTRPCTSLSIRTADGEFTANERIFQGGATIGPGNHRIRLRPIRGHFEVRGAQEAAYWVLPLSNFILDWWPPPQICPTELARHPLRIYPTPDLPPDLLKEDEQIATAWANQRNTLLRFTIDGNSGFIEQLPAYRRKIDRLRRGRSANRITAVMVGATSVQSIDFADYDRLFPLDILSLLTLATGVPVGAPWIEFRDARGKLVRRIHIDFGRPLYEKGHAAIFDLGRNAIGYLIARAFSSPDCGQKGRSICALP